MSYLKSRFNALLQDLRAAKNQSMKWFQDAIRQISGSTVADQRKRLEPVRSMTPKLQGRMVCFFYNPKWRDILPYYDRFPLVFPVSFGRGYFIG